MTEKITDTVGFDFVITEDITKKDYITLCKLISNHLNQLHDLTGKARIKIIPDLTSEPGDEGMLFTGTGGQYQDKYKVFKHQINGEFI